MPLAAAVALTQLWDQAMLSPMKLAAFPFTVLVRGAAFGSDGVKTALQFCESFIDRHERSPTGARSYQNVASHDHRIGLAMWAQHLFRDAIREGPWLRAAALATAGDIIKEWWEQANGQTPSRRPDARVWPPPLVDFADPSIGDAMAQDNVWPTLFSAIALRESGPDRTSSVATGLSVTGKGLSENETAHGSRPLAYSDALKSAVNAGARARRDKERGYRVFKAVRDL
jgi:hypothetical protein